jgi:putative SOS response-associated peptidase YedK
VSDRDELQRLLVANAAGTLVHYPVGKDVGNVRNDGPQLIEAIALDGDPGQNSL